MDEMLARLNKIYPNSGFVAIPKYDPAIWVNKQYDSKFDTKAPMNSWKTKPLSYDEAQQKVEEGFRIGWVIPQSIVVVDVDNKDCELSQLKLERLLKKFEVKYNYNYTSRGIHLVFRDPTEKIKSNAEMKCALNIMIDTRANKTGYIILPCNDPHREWGEWNDFVEDIPYFLLPVTKANTPTFIGMQNGDGRNDALFKWRTVLEKSKMLSKDEIEKSIRIINENLFDTPMPNNELFKTVLRDRDSIDDIKQERKANQYNIMAEELIAKYDIISYYENYYIFDGTYYKQITDLELERLIHYEISVDLSNAARKEIMKFIAVKTQSNINDFDKVWYKIACKNGVINLVTGQLEQPNKSEINTICLPHDYNMDPPYSPRIDQFMKDVTGGDVIKMQFLYQIAGYALLKKNLFEKFFIMKGEGSTGKSTFTNLIRMMVGKNNCSNVGLAEFDKDYYISTLLSKLVNIDDDVVDRKLLENTGRFKSIISGNVISTRQIYKSVLEFEPYAMVIFNCNRLPRIMDKTSGLYRRMILVELNTKVEKPDPMFLSKVTELDMEYFIYKAVEGIKLAIEEGRFRISYSEEALLKLFKRRQSPLNEWLYETDMCLEDLVNKKVQPLYSEFIEWCGNNGYTKTMSSYTYKEDMCALYDMEVAYQPNEKGANIQVFYKRGDYDPKYKPF